MVKNLPAYAGDPDLIPGLGRSLGEGNGTLLQYSCLGNPIELEKVRHNFMTKQQQIHKYIVDHNELWKILKEMGISDHPTCLQRNLYTGQEATVSRTWNSRLVPNRKRRMSRLYIVTLLI